MESLALLNFLSSGIFLIMPILIFMRLVKINKELKKAAEEEIAERKRIKELLTTISQSLQKPTESE